MTVVDTVGTPFLSRIIITLNARRMSVATGIIDRIQDVYSRLRCRVHKENQAGIRLVESNGLHRKRKGRYAELWWYDTQLDNVDDKYPLGGFLPSQDRADV